MTTLTEYLLLILLATHASLLSVIRCASATSSDLPSDLQLWPCDSNNPLQRWKITQIDSVTVSISLNNADGKCLDCTMCYPQGERSPNPGIAMCNSSFPLSQKWVFAKDSTIRTSMNTHDWMGEKFDPGGCMYPLSDQPAAAIVMRYCTVVDKDSSFLWNFVEDTGTIKHVFSGLCLDAGTTNHFSCNSTPLKNLPFCDPDRSVSERVHDLVGRMSLGEKCHLISRANEGVRRLGVLPIRFGEALHGVAVECLPPAITAADSSGCATSLPHALALGATFNRTLWRASGSLISTEARVFFNYDDGPLIVFSPDINLFRDPRWGRGQEVPGEDPFLTSEYASCFIGSMQRGEDSRYLKVASTAKHYAAYDLENWHGYNRGSFDASVSPKDLVEYYLPAFRAAVQRGGVQGIMSSYNAVNGVPNIANHYLMTEIARDLWDFRGFFISDCWGVMGIQYLHNFTNTTGDTCSATISGGLDVDCGPFFRVRLQDSVQQGYISEKRIDDAAVRLLEVVFQLGLFDPSSQILYSNFGPELVDNDKGRALALEAAEQAIVLLQNKNDLLPFSPRTRISVVGPHFNSTQDLLSNYHGTNTLVESYSPLQSLQRRGIVSGYARGASFEGNDTSGFDQALSVVKQSEVAVVFVGLRPISGLVAGESEGWDREDLSLPAIQLEFIKAVVTTGVKTVVVLINGGPLAIEWIIENVHSIVEVWYPGEVGGDAIANVLLGYSNPSGRLPITYYDADFVNRRNMTDMSLTSKEGITYRYYSGQPLFEFGWGLSYSNFSYSWDTPSDMNVRVKNTGKFNGEVVVLGFIINKDSKDPLRKKLFDFQRVYLRIGQSEVVSFSFSPEVFLGTNFGKNDEVVASAKCHNQFAVQVGDPHHGWLDGTVSFLEGGKTSRFFPSI